MHHLVRQELNQDRISLYVPDGRYYLIHDATLTNDVQKAEPYYVLSTRPAFLPGFAESIYFTSCMCTKATAADLHGSAMGASNRPIIVMPTHSFTIIDHNASGLPPSSISGSILYSEILI